MQDLTVTVPLTPIPATDRVVHHNGNRIEFTRDQIARLFWAKVEKTIGGCWEWTGKKLPTGYGVLAIAKRRLYSHRVSYEIHRGTIPEGLHLDHLCRNRACCNPEHLEAVTCKTNIMRSPIAPAAINAAKTHCDNGHEFTQENTYQGRDGRYCRQCKRDRDRRRYHAKKSGQVMTHQPHPHPEPSPAAEPTPRCPAAHAEDPTPCGGPLAVTITDTRGATATGCEHHAARMLASLNGARVHPLPDGPDGAAIRVFTAADGIRPYPWLTDTPRTRDDQLSHAETRARRGR